MNALPLTKVRARFSDLINRVVYKQERIIVSKNGKPVAAIIPMYQMNDEHYQQWLDELEKVIHLQRAYQALEAPPDSSVSEEELRRRLGI